jgi:sugar lactone lactonase YvrE
MTMKAQLYADVCHDLAEGPVWHENALWWVNITRGQLNRFDPTTGKVTALDVGDTLGVALPGRDGWWWCARTYDCAWLHAESGRVVPIIPAPELATEHRFNDGFCGPDGHPWVGSAALDGSKGRASLYRSNGDGTLEIAWPGITLSNGLGWSPDGRTCYYVDTLSFELAAFAYDLETHRLGERRVLRSFPQDGGLPDGLTIDIDGHIWLAFWGGSVVLHLDGRTGETLGQVDLPVTQVTSSCFGGADGSTLYITSARGGLNEAALAEQPHAGSIFTVATNTRGLPPPHCSLTPPAL